MAYDQYNNYEPPGRTYYGREKQGPPGPQAHSYDQQYQQGQDSGYYSQGGYDQYNDGYGDNGQWGSQQQHYQGHGYDQGYDQSYNGYDDYGGGYDQNPRRQMGHGPGRGPQPGPGNNHHQQQQQQQQPRQKNYGPGGPIRANVPPPDRQNLGQGHQQRQQHHPGQHPDQQRAPPRHNGYARAESRQDEYGGQNGAFGAGDNRAPPAPWNNTGGRNSPGPGERPPAAPWSGNNGSSSPGPGQRIGGAAPRADNGGTGSPAPGRESPTPRIEPIGGRPGSRSRSQRERMDAQRRGPMNDMRQDSQMALPMDNPFPTFPTKREEAKKKMQAQRAIPEDGVAKMRLDDDGPRPGPMRQDTAQTMPVRPGTSQATRPDMAVRPGTAQGNRADQRRAPGPGWDQQQSQHSGRQQDRAQEGYHAQSSWPLADEMAPPKPAFSMPARPSTATGVREAPDPRGLPNGPSDGMGQNSSRGAPQLRRRSTDQAYNAPGAAITSYDAEGFGQQSHGQHSLGQPDYGQQQKQGQHETSSAQHPRQTMGYSSFGANPYADEIPDMPDFDAQPANNRHEHEISMHMGTGAGPIQRAGSAPPPTGFQNDYGSNGGYDDGYGHNNQQMYSQPPGGQPDLRGQHDGYGYSGAPSPNRGPGMGPRGGGRGMPPAPGGMGRGQLPGRPGMPPMSRLQTGDSQWSDPGMRGQTGSPMSARPRMDGMSPQQMQNPDSLPSHPTPVRPGHMEGGFNNKPPPVRQYNNANSAPNSNPAAGRQSNEQNRSSTSTTASNGPVTHEELQRLQSIVKVDPSDHKSALALAKRMIEAASSDLVNVHQDPKARQKAREKFTFDAHKILKKLAQQQHAEGMFYLADCHGQGLMGLAPDPKEAFSLYQAAAKLGHPASAYRTAVCCEMGADEGGGTRKDPLKAVQWYRRAASLGEPAAMYKLGMILLKGLLGQQRNVGEACNWLQRAADRADKENPHALHELGLLYAAPPNDSKIIRDDKYAAQLFEKAARLGYKFSQFRLGEAFEYGLLGLPIDQRSSIAWYSKAAAQAEHQSELALSGWYLTGAPPILEQSDTEAYLWARKAAQAELPKGLFALGYFTEVGIGCPRSLDEAKKWYGRAAALRYPKAQERLEELRRGGYKAQKSRERLSRSDRRQQDDGCTVM